MATEIPQTMIKDTQVNDSFALKSIEGKEADKVPSIAIQLPISADTPIKT